MSNHGKQDDTQILPREPIRDWSQAPHTAIRRASMTNGFPGGKQMPTRRPPQHDDTRKKKQRSKKQRRFRPVGCITAALFGLIFLVFTAFSVCSLIAASRVRIEPTNTRSLSASPADDADTRNILLLTVDNDANTASNITLLTYQSAKKTILTTAIHPDCFVSIPEHGTNRIGAAYSFGGAPLIMDTIVNNFNLRIDEYFAIPKEGFEKLSDALGGLEFEPETPEIANLNAQITGETYRTGQPATGMQAYAYTQLDIADDTVPQYLNRKTRVLHALLNRLTKPSPSAIPALIRDIMPYVTTNLSVGSLYKISLTLPLKTLRYDRKTLAFPAEGTYDSVQNANGQTVLAVDYDANLRAFFAIFE